MHRLHRSPLFFILKNTRHFLPTIVSVGLLLMIGLISFEGFAQTTTQPFTSSGTFIVPVTGVSSVQVEAWGGGGGGGGINSNSNNNRAGGGGGGGAYTINAFLNVTPGAIIPVTVGGGGLGGTILSNGGNGGNSSFTSGATTVTAFGGTGGQTASYLTNGNFGTGGSSGAGTYSGGAGAAGANGYGGGGGGGAGSTGAGNTASGSAAGAGGSGTGGGAGAAGRTGGGGDGISATATFGGGGGGARSNNNTDRTGGAGAGGQVVISYTLPNVSNLTVAATPIICAGNAVSFTISSNTLQTGNYTITYNVTGTSNSISSTTTTFSFTAGSPGTGTLTTAVSLFTAETDVLRITRITDNSTANFTTITTSNTSFTVSACRSWYSYKNGNFNDYKNWTLDPSGTTFYNGLNLIPTNGDDITILNGKTITHNINNISLSNTIIQSGATLDMAATTGHNLGTVTGQGLLRVKGAALPSGIYTDFVSSTGGTNEFYDVGGTLSITQTIYNNLRFTNSGASSAAVTFIEANDLTVNGTVTVGSASANTATWQINDNSNTTRTIVLNGDLTVASGGRITAGTGNASSTTPHSLTMYGNITNNGRIQFFDPTQAPFTSSNTSSAVLTSALKGNAVNVTFNGTANQTVTCNNQTDFYRFIVDKGTSQQAMVTVNSSAANNMRLFGSASIGSTGNSSTDYSNNALSLINGTLQLTGTLTIPTLIETTTIGDGSGSGPVVFAIPQTVALWLNSPNVSVTNTINVSGTNYDQRFLVNGQFRVSNGSFFNGGFSRGINSSAGGSVIIEGINTVVNIWQYRPYANGTLISTYQQTGGTLNVGTTGYNSTPVTAGPDDGTNTAATDQYARFSLASSNSSFQMSGGTINIGSPTTPAAGKNAQAGGLDIQSLPANYSVTGGTINMYIPQLNATASPVSGAHNFGIYSTAPLYNVNIYREGSAGPLTYAATLNGATTILGNLTLFNNASLSGSNVTTLLCNNNALTIGGNLTIPSNTAFYTGTAVGTTSGTDPNRATGIGAITAAGTGTITFNGSGAQTWTYASTVTVLTSNTVVVNKSAGILSVATGNTLPSIGTLTLTSGTFNDGGSIVTVTTGLSNSATHISGTGGSITYSAVGGTIGGNNGTFGNLILSGNNSVTTMSGNQTVTGDLRITGTGAATTPEILNIGSNNLTVNGAIATTSTGTTANFGHNIYILTSGLHNAGGLTRPASANTPVLFPLGVLAPNQTVITTSVNRQYTPNTITVSSATTFGNITVRSVNNTHPNVTTQSASLAYYWRVTSSGFAGTGTVTHTTYQFADGTGTAPTRGGTQSQYVAARYDRANNTWGYFIGTGTAGAPQTQTMATKILPDPLNTATTWTGVTGSQLDGEYTCGNSSAFGTVTVYYSITGTNASPANWNANSTWSTDAVNKHAGAAAASNPTSCSTCPVVIGDGSTYNHYVSIPATGISAAILSQMCGTLTINTGSTLDCGNTVTSSTALGFGTNTTVSSTIGGTGTLRMGLLGFFPSGDFTNFIGSGGGTVEYYGLNATARTIPSTYNSPVNATQPLATYYNLIISPFAGQTITLPNNSLTIYNNMTEGSSSTYTGTVVTNGSSQAISVGGDLMVSYGTFNFATTPSGSVTTLKVTGNIVNNGTFSCAATTANNQTTTHLINVFGGITNNNVMNLRQYTSGTRYNFADITFSGISNVTFGGTGTGGTTLDLVTVNKGTSQSPTVTFSLGGTLNTTPVALGWLTLTNGTFDFEYTGATSPVTLSSSSFTIPSSTQLKVGSGVVQITNASGGNNDLFLNGTLQVAGGTVYTNTANATGSGNDIEYASAGTPTIIVSGGSLTVDASIRRSFNTLTGALVYNQSGGTVTVGGNGSDNTRGVFEIEANTGSSFTMAGNSILNVQRQAGGTGYTDLYINPVTSSVDATSTINVGLSSLNTNTNFRVYVVPAIGNFTVVGTNAQSVNLYNNLAVGGSLTINSPSTFSATQPNPDANVTIAGDFNCTGTYTGGTNTTTFNGTGLQSAKLTTTTQFYDVTVNKPTGKVTVFGTAPAAPGLNNLNILSGTLKVGNSVDSVLTSTLKVNRNITINGTQIGTQAIEVYSTSGISNAIISSGGAFTNFTLGGTVSNATVAVSGNLTINGALNLLNNTNGATNRYLNIGSGQLTFGSAASASNAGSTAFIRTNGVASDLGVVKNWTSNGTFIYPVGTASNYTPISYSLNVTSAGTLTIVPVNSVHNTALTVSNTDYILNYYWTVTRSSTLAATPSGNFTFKCPSSLLSGTTGSLVPGYLDPNALNSNGGWVTNVAGSTAAIASGTLTLTFPSTPTTDFPSVNPYYYDYSAGTTITLPNPIKGVYSRKGPATPPMITGGGNWTTGTNWTFEVDGDPTNTHPSSIYASAYYSYPHGLPVTILPGAQINLDADAQIAYKTTINGVLYNASTTGHNLGAINGTGTFRTATGTFPAGNYDAFVASTGGTIEYASTTTMNSLTTYNNLVISNKTQNNTNAPSASIVTMTASNITVNGSLTINASGIGGSPNIVDDSQNTSGQGNISIAKDFVNGGTFLEGASNVSITGNLTNTGTLTDVTGIISVGKDWLNTGTFNAGTGTVTFNGTGAQNANGITTFNNLTLNKSNNLTLGSVATVGGILTLNAGNIISNAFPASPLLVLAAAATSSGGSSSSFIAGQVQKVMNGGASFTYPTGSISGSRYRPVSVFNTSGSDTWNVSYVGNDPGTNGFSSLMFNNSNMAKVSQYEYWQVANTTGTTTAGLTLSYGPGSYGTSSIGDVTKLKTARWNGTQWDIPPGGGVFSQSGDDVSGTVSVSFQNSFSPQTLASDDQFSSLPITLISFTGNRLGNGVILNWSTAQEVNNDRFEVERSSDGYEFKKIATVQGAGNSAVTKHYVTTDKEFVSGVLYYRLRQVDFDEKFSYSNVVKVDPANGLEQAWIAYPNPVGTEGSLQIGKADITVDENVTVDIVFQSSEGRILLRGNGTVKEINKRLSGSMTDLAAGIYILQVFDGSSNNVLRIVKH